MKITFRIVLCMTILPILLGLLGMLLSAVFDCSGMSHIETCGVPGAQRFVSPLIAFVWVSMFAVPIGIGTLVLLTVVNRARNAIDNRRQSK